MSGYYTKGDLERLDAEIARVAKITAENEVKAAEWRLAHRERIAAQEAYNKERAARMEEQQAAWLAEVRAREAERYEREARAQATRLANLEARTPEVEQRIRRSRVDWNELIEDQLVADRQAQWERRRTALAMSNAGMTVAEIGKRLCVSGGRAGQLVQKAWREDGDPSPAEQYLNNAATAVATSMVTDWRICHSIKPTMEALFPPWWPKQADEDTWIWMGIAA